MNIPLPIMKLYETLYILHITYDIYNLIKHSLNIHCFFHVLKFYNFQKIFIIFKKFL